MNRRLNSQAALAAAGIEISRAQRRQIKTVDPKSEHAHIDTEGRQPTNAEQQPPSQPMRRYGQMPAFCLTRSATALLSGFDVLHAEQNEQADATTR